MATYKVQLNYGSGSSGILEEYVVEAPTEGKATAKAKAICKKENPGFSQVIVCNWVHEIESTSTESSGSNGGGEALGAVAGATVGVAGWMINQAKRESSGSDLFYVDYHKRYGEKTGDWSGYEKAIKERKEFHKKGMIAFGAFCSFPFVLMFVMMTWEFLLPASLLAGGGYLYHKKNNNK
tara:strand:- start:256 stop:795 length:540 start_codon:yes stop_codon:yes gene_type:complete